MAGPRPDTWMPWYVGDYLADTMHLSTELHGAYCLLIMASWKLQGALPDDDEALSGVTKLPLPRWRQVRPRLEAFFEVADGEWRQKRVRAELEKAGNITSARQKAGKLGGKRSAEAKQTRQQNHEQKPQQIGKQTTQQKATPSPSPSQSQEELSEASRTDPASSTPAEGVAAAFEAKHREIWPDYGEFRLLRRFPTSLLPDVQAWLDRGLSPALLAATLAEAMDRWRRDAEPPKGLRPFQRELEQAAALAKGRAATGTGALTQAEDDRLAYLTAHLRPDLDAMWLPEWGAKPKTPEEAQAELDRLIAKRDGKAAA